MTSLLSPTHSPLSMKKLPTLTWICSRTIAITLLISTNNTNLRQRITFLPPHLRKAILFFVTRTGLPQHADSNFVLTDDDLSCLLCSQFNDLDLSKSDVLGGITQHGWSSIRNQCPSLLSLNCERWQDRTSLISLVSCHPTLTSLNLSRIFGSLTNEHMSAIFSTDGLPNLMTLNVSHNENVSDVSMHALRSCKKLTDINVNCCYRITDKGIGALLGACEHPLRSLCIKRCTFITDQPVSFFCFRQIEPTFHTSFLFFKYTGISHVSLFFLFFFLFSGFGLVLYYFSADAACSAIVVH